MYSRFSALARSLVKNLPSSLSLRPYSDVLFVSDGAQWVLNWEMREVSNIVEKLDIRVRLSPPLSFGFPRQSIFFTNKYFLMRPRRYLLRNNRIAFPYFHGYPDPVDPISVVCYESLKIYHRKICRVQVSHSRMRELVLSTDISPSKVFLIPIGINMSFFQLQTPESRKAMRNKYDIPQQAIVIGSFQKDGVGWGEGNDPKLIKGPDVFLETVRILKESLSDIFILLSGPARGYVKKELEHLKIPFKHVYFKNYPQIGELYQCLDLYIVASREEGGPKAILESMASGIPLITTKVGQAMDLVYHAKNGWMVDVEDAEGLAYWAEKALTTDSMSLQMVLDAGFKTAQANTYEAQTGLWKAFFQGFVEDKGLTPELSK